MTRCPPRPGVQPAALAPAPPPTRPKKTPIQTSTARVSTRTRTPQANADPAPPTPGPAPAQHPRQHLHQHAPTRRRSSTSALASTCTSTRTLLRHQSTGSKAHTAIHLAAALCSGHQECTRAPLPILAKGTPIALTIWEITRNNARHGQVNQGNVECSACSQMNNGTTQSASPRAARSYCPSAWYMMPR